MAFREVTHRHVALGILQEYHAPRTAVPLPLALQFRQAEQPVLLRSLPGPVGRAQHPCVGRVGQVALQPGLELVVLRQALVEPGGQLRSPQHLVHEEMDVLVGQQVVEVGPLGVALHEDAAQFAVGAEEAGLPSRFLPGGPGRALKIRTAAQHVDDGQGSGPDAEPLLQQVRREPEAFVHADGDREMTESEKKMTASSLRQPKSGTPSCTCTSLGRRNLVYE